MSIGTETVVSVGDRGKFKVDTKIDLTGFTAVAVYLYSEADWDAEAAPTKTLTADAPTPSNGIIEADMISDTFAAAGKYYLRSGVTWANGEVLGAPAEFLVLRGKGS